MVYTPFEADDEIELSPQVVRYILNFYKFCFGMAILYIIYN